MDVYKSIKRSVSSKATNIIGSSRYSNQTSFIPEQKTEPISTWIHPPDLLIKGCVEYQVIMFGFVDVSNSKGIAVVQDAIVKLRSQALTKQNETGKIPKTKKIKLQISVNGVNIIDPKTNAIQFKHPIHRISYCVKDKQKMLSFIAKNDVEKLQCFVFLCEKMVDNIEKTICQACDLALERHAKKKQRAFEDQNQIIFLLRKKVSELESYSAQLEAKLARCVCTQSTKDLLIPLSPIPPRPPLDGTISNVYSLPLKPFSSPPPLPLAPPPRRASATQNDTKQILEEVFQQQQKQNGSISVPTNVFDNNFNPREDEKKNCIGHASVVETIKSKTTQDLEELLHRLDFQNKEENAYHLDRGEIEDTLNDWPVNLEDESDENPSQISGPSLKN
ncbi:PID domain-containing protein [Meloidogyne graminicola]|uniref:PID domain-containing protein n=1 Tax=Meloidogyne graminicola TaxID=189291 RepID=A0A8S9ZT70_9BILA|nr:PID domain-containing protein [Meloidogyne graminicola]